MVRTRGPDRPCEGEVLVVDDQQMVLDIARQLLENAGFCVHPARSGREALRIYNEQADRIDCVLLDLEMPEMNGEATHAGLRRIRADVRVILSSGFDEEDVRKRFGDGDIVGFVQKPYRLKTLKMVVRRALGER